MRNLIILSIVVFVVYGFGAWRFYKLNKQLLNKDDNVIENRITSIKTKGKNSEIS